jgi:hypothetical protein
MSEVTQEVAGELAPSESELANQTEQNTPEVTAAEGEVEKQEQVEERKFSQAELDAAIQKRLLKEQRRWNRQLSQQLEEVKTGPKEPPKRESFGDDSEFQQALIEHEAERRAEAKLRERAAKEEEESVNQRFLEKAEEAADRYEDFFSVVGNPSVHITPEMVEFFAESDVGADLAYYLGKHPKKAAEIANLSVGKAARELTKLEAELASKPKANPSKAPEPISPVSSRGKSSATTQPSDDDDIETWMRKERERQRRG